MSVSKTTTYITTKSFLLPVIKTQSQIDWKAHFHPAFLYFRLEVWLILDNIHLIHSVQRGINPPSTTPTPSFLPRPPPPLKSANGPSPSPPPFLGNPPLYVGFSWTPPTKSWIFQWTPKILKLPSLNS